MTGNAQKTPLTSSLNDLAIRQAAQAIKTTGRSLPCKVSAISGQMVTVSFALNAAPFTLPAVTMPIATSRYDWLPIQVGDVGVAYSADAYLGGISGLGGGVADLTQRGNLSTLVFVPIAQTAFASLDPQKRVVQGPKGVIMQAIGGSTRIDVDEDAQTITLTAGSVSLIITPSGISIGGKDFLTHEHVDGGGVGNSGTVA